MFWVIVATLFFYCLANVSTLYSLLYVHKRVGLSALWGYAPNQFLFLVLFFPFAAFGAFTALHLLVSKVAPGVPYSLTIRSILSNWSIFVVIGLGVSAIVTASVYMSSAMSLDKLKPVYAERTLSLLQKAEDRLMKEPPENRNEFRKRVLKKAQLDTKALTLPEPSTDDEGIRTWMEQLAPDVYLQVVQSRDHQRTLRLMNPTVHALNIFQLNASVFVAWCCVFCFGVSWVLVSHVPTPFSTLNEFDKVCEALFFSVIAFGMFPVCFAQYRAQLDQFVGVWPTMRQEYLSAIPVMFLLIMLATFKPNGDTVSILVLLRYIPPALVALGTLVSPDILRSLIGADARIGTQVILGVLWSLYAAMEIYRFWPGR